MAKKRSTSTYIFWALVIVGLIYLWTNRNRALSNTGSLQMNVEGLDMQGTSEAEDMGDAGRAGPDNELMYSRSMMKPPTEYTYGQDGKIQASNIGDSKLVGASVHSDGRTMQMDAEAQMKKLDQASCFPKNQLSADELLPKDNGSLWAQVNPSGVGPMKDKNFLVAGHHVGINTVGQTLRNANLQLRSEPANPQIVGITPWNQTTIEPDMNRRPLEVGGC